MHPELETFIGQDVILDTDSTWLYIGTLERVAEGCAVLKDADAHDCSDSLTSKEVYVYEARTTGIRSNRESVHVSLDHVISFSRLKDVKKF